LQDKTGTLTENVMEFAKCSIDGVKYVEARYEVSSKRRKSQLKQSGGQPAELGSDVSSVGATEEDAELKTIGPVGKVIQVSGHLPINSLLVGTG
jgi:magnesium-transporting ATPase (P-type)